MSTGTALRVGADVVSVHQVEASVARFGSRYLERVYTQHELESSVGRSPVRAASLAARFAAKEATFKVLRPVGHQPDWRSVEVRRHAERLVHHGALRSCRSVGRPSRHRGAGGEFDP